VQTPNEAENYLEQVDQDVASARREQKNLRRQCMCASLYSGGSAKDVLHKSYENLLYLDSTDNIVDMLPGVVWGSTEKKKKHHHHHHSHRRHSRSHQKQPHRSEDEEDDFTGAGIRMEDLDGDDDEVDADDIEANIVPVGADDSTSNSMKDLGSAVSPHPDIRDSTRSSKLEKARNSRRFSIENATSDATPHPGSQSTRFDSSRSPLNYLVGDDPSPLDPALTSFDELDDAEGWQTMDSAKMASKRAATSNLMAGHTSSRSRASSGDTAGYSSHYSSKRNSYAAASGTGGLRYESFRDVVRNIGNFGKSANNNSSSSSSAATNAQHERAAGSSSMRRPSLSMLDTSLANFTASFGFGSSKENAAPANVASTNNERANLLAGPSAKRISYDGRTTGAVAGPTAGSNRTSLRQQRLSSAISSQSLDTRSSEYDLLGYSR
jgi:hypothetical protein